MAIPKFTPQKRDEVRKLAENGLPLNEIVRIVGISDTTIRRFCKEEGITLSVTPHARLGPLRFNPVLPVATESMMAAESEYFSRQRAADRRFVRALAMAFQRGDHLPAGQVPVLRLIG